MNRSAERGGLTTLVKTARAQTARKRTARTQGSSESATAASMALSQLASSAPPRLASERDCVCPAAREMQKLRNSEALTGTRLTKKPTVQAKATVTQNELDPA